MNKKAAADKFIFILRPGNREYIKEAAWVNRTNMTDYLNTLIEADKKNNENIKKN